jgi:hypothetical protein
LLIYQEEAELTEGPSSGSSASYLRRSGIAPHEGLASIIMPTKLVTKISLVGTSNSNRPHENLKPTYSEFTWHQLL